ncbi:MAG: flavin reductase family protein [Deinococcales bacterium]
MLDPNDFKQAMSRFPSGVTVITARHEGETHGMTASAFISVSLNPPLVLESVAKKARMHEILMNASHYGVSILRQDQAEHSNHFAGFGREDFEAVFMELHNMPLIEGAVAYVVCKIVDRHEAGDHTLFIGEVEAAQIAEGEPLLYFKRQYGVFKAQ